MSSDLRLVAIADAAVLRGRDLVAAAYAAEAGGATMLQVRLKQAPAGELYRVTHRLVERLGIPVVVNDRADVAWVTGAHGVHLGADDVPAAAVRGCTPLPFTIGVSVGSPEEAEAVRAAGVDYWSVGPFRSTASKGDAGQPLGVAGFRRLAALAPRGMPVIAIGGITAEIAGDAIGGGAAGVAVIGAVFAAGDIEAASRRLRDAVDRALAAR